MYRTKPKLLGSEALTAQPTRELHVLGHDRHPAAVDSAQTRVGEEVDHVCLGGLLHRKDGAGLEAQVLLAFRGDLADKSLEGELAEEQFGALLVAADLAQRRRSRGGT